MAFGLKKAKEEGLKVYYYIEPCSRNAIYGTNLS